MKAKERTLLISSGLLFTPLNPKRLKIKFLSISFGFSNELFSLFHRNCKWILMNGKLNESWKDGVFFSFLELISFKRSEEKLRLDECIRAGAFCGALRLEGASNLVENQINLAAGRSPFVPETRANRRNGTSRRSGRPVQLTLN